MWKSPPRRAAWSCRLHNGVRTAATCFPGSRPELSDFATRIRDILLKRLIMTLKMYSPATFARYKMYMSPQERRLVKSAPDKLWSQPQTSWTSTTADESNGVAELCLSGKITCPLTWPDNAHRTAAKQRGIPYRRTDQSVTSAQASSDATGRTHGTDPAAPAQLPDSNLGAGMGFEPMSFAPTSSDDKREPYFGFLPPIVEKWQACEPDLRGRMPMFCGASRVCFDNVDCLFRMFFVYVHVSECSQMLGPGNVHRTIAFDRSSAAQTVQTTAGQAAARQMATRRQRPRDQATDAHQSQQEREREETAGWAIRDRISREVATAPDNGVKPVRQTPSRPAAPTLPKINNLFVQTGSTAGISTCASNSNKSKTFAKGWAEARAETVGRDKLPATINGRTQVKNSARSCPDLSRNKAVTLPQRAQTTTDGKNNKKNSSCPQTAALRSQGGLPHWKSEHILTPREVQTYTKLKSVYLNDTWQKQRRNFILQKLEDIQLEEVKRYARDVHHRKKRLLETIETQKKQLADVRQKYENEQLQRFRSQYVTWKSVETEKLTRHIYGLPEDLNKDMVPKTNLKRKSKPPKKRWRQAAQRAVNVKKFASILKPTGTRPVELKDPLMDGIDTVLLDTDLSSAKPKKKMVKSVLQEAKNIIHEADDTNIDTFSEVSTPVSSRAGSDEEDDGSDSDSWQSMNSDDPVPKLYSSEDTDREE
ncbi:hypothetical protein Bbelb_224680 [Branchiostoma belcheri]|nr:hypothetical protein Bbelb_224680 [Branchiostoma belcheri]